MESMVHDIVLEEDALQIEDLEERSELISAFLNVCHFVP